jgi:hypothetical protein
MILQESGTFNASGADLYVGLGFVPDWVKIMTLESTDEERIEWSRNMRSAEAFGGFDIDDDGVISPITIGLGIAEDLGGVDITSASTIYIGRRADEDMRDAGTGDVINAWTLDVPANRTGHFNAGVNTTHVGVGSIVGIGKDSFGNAEFATILAITNDGDAANEITLSKAIKSGNVLKLGPMYDYVGLPAGAITKPGFFIDSTAAINTAGQMCMFEAGTYN